MKLKTVTICIPAHNEEQNILNLLGNIYSQVITKAKLEKICVVSDASTDNTNSLVKTYGRHHPEVQLLFHAVKRGKAVGMMEVFSQASSDVVVVIDADSRLNETDFIDQLIGPVIADAADLTSADQIEKSPEIWFEKCLWVSARIKHRSFKNFRKGDNFFNCHGQARSFSMRLYKSIRFPQNSGEDLYSYIYCRENGFKFRFVHECSIIYKLPSNFKDHERQSARYFHAARQFGKPLTMEIPYISLAFWSIIYLVRYPHLLLPYLVICFVIKVKTLFQTPAADLWTASASTKIAI